MLQEQVSEYLGVTSFKRKYPGRRERFSINHFVISMLYDMLFLAKQQHKPSFSCRLGKEGPVPQREALSEGTERHHRDTMHPG